MKVGHQKRYSFYLAFSLGMLILGNQPLCSEAAYAIGRGFWFSGLAEVPGDSQHHLPCKPSECYLESRSSSLEQDCLTDSVWSTDEPPC